jgi:hypothetical protein
MLSFLRLLLARLETKFLPGSSFAAQNFWIYRIDLPRRQKAVEQAKIPLR